MKKQYRIGIFDSGIGGLTVLKALKKIMPNEHYLYFGDTARVPYGSKSKKTIQFFASQIIDFLIEKKIKIIVVACNTVSSLALDFLKHKYKQIPIFGVVSPGSQTALEKTKLNKIGVIGTVGTINSNSYKNKIVSMKKNAKVYQQACPLFVPLVETGWAHTEIAQLTAQTYLQPLIKKHIDTLVLGCTHYPVLYKTIKKTVGPNVIIVDSATATAIEVKQYLQNNFLMNTKKSIGQTQYWLSDESIYFKKAAKYILNENIKIKIKKLR